MARVVAAMPVPEPPKGEEVEENAGKSHDSHSPALIVGQRHDKLFDELDLSGLDLWTPELADAACQLLAKYHDVFSLDPAELGCTHSTEHIIKVTDDTPFKECFRQIPPWMVEEVRNHLKEMLESGTFRPSQSPWCNAVVLVWKKDGSLCFCIDFCHLNAHTKKDSYHLPRIQEVLESLVGAGHFSCLDLKSGFLQIKMEEASKQYTTFTVGNLGFFECDQMPFGLCNTPDTFQRLMQNCMGELNLIYCLIYLDDLIVFLQTAEEHIHQLCVIFDWLREYNLKLKPLKCSLFKEEINYLAHQVTKQGIWPSNTNLKAIAECALPQTYTEIRAFLGLVGHYRWFIKGFVQIAQLLNEHLAWEGASRKLEQVLLSEDTLEAFQALKQACMNSPVLAFANYMKDFSLKTDASKEGLGAVLSQKQADGRFHLVAYGSRALTAHKKNYQSTKLEFLALKWAITEHFKEYLLYQPFIVKTDNNPLTYIMTTPNLDATGHQWVEALPKFNFQLEYQKGWENAVGDALSQITTHLGLEAVHAILDGAIIGASQRAEGEDPTVIEGDQQREKEVWVTTGWVLVQMHVTNWVAAQKEDPEPHAVLQWFKSKKKTDLRTLLREYASSEEGQMVWRNHQNFTTLWGTLYLCSTPKGENEDLLLFMVPRTHWTAALNGCHWNAGYQGCDHTLSLLQEHFWWPGMAK